jgi:hypothetical protein
VVPKSLAGYPHFVDVSVRTAPVLLGVAVYLEKAL